MGRGKRGEIEGLKALIAQIEDGDRHAGRGDSGSPVTGEAAGREGREAPSEGKRAYRRAVDLCSHHDFPSKGMEERLLREGFSADAAREAVREAERVCLIDDRRWGEMRAAALMRRGMGIPGIERDLRGNGIDPASIPGWPRSFSERYGDELSRAMRLIEARPPRSKNPRASAYARIIRKGYSPEVAVKATQSMPAPGR